VSGSGWLKIGQVAERAGVGVETVRFYERHGLVDEPPRTESGYRQYSEEAVARLRFIRRTKSLGFSLHEIRELISLRLDAATDVGEVRWRAQAKIGEIEEKVVDLQRMRQALERLVESCDGSGALDACPILRALDTGEP
jgi:MerR family copper efflux transcriptional regulator